MTILDQIDEAIYTNKFNHVYLYDEISNNSVLQVQQAIDELNRSKNENGVRTKPKPIILHINSPGGLLVSGIALTRIISKSRVPIIVLVEGMSASAATLITVMAKYRVISPYATMMIHQLSSGAHGTHEETAFQQKQSDIYMRILSKIYEQYTELSKAKLQNILKRDLFLSPSLCLKYGLVDHILKTPPKSAITHYYTANPEYRLTMNVVNRKTNFNNIYLYENASQNDGSQIEWNPVDTVFRIQSVMTMLELPKPIYIHISDLGIINDIVDITPIINTIIMSRVPVYVSIDAPIMQPMFLIALVCHRRYIYKYSYIEIDFVNLAYRSTKFSDINDNTKLIKDNIISLYKKYSKLPKQMLKGLFKERFIINPKQAVEYGLCDEII